MKKIPTLFKREFSNNHVVSITDEVTPGCEWVLKGEGCATIKVDGACCCVYKGKFYKRYDAKNGSPPPKGAIPCGKPDAVTGHWPHWLLVDKHKPEDRWFVEAYKNRKKKSNRRVLTDGTYEAIGPHFRNNPYHLASDTLVKHGTVIIDVERTFNGIREFLQNHDDMEGIVFWKDGRPGCKIKRTDFGFKWDGMPNK